jgi:DNA-binding Lrp family transcriptional regulator
MMGDWTVFSNHGHVLVCLARNNEARLRDVAADVGITERAVQKIVRELQQGGLINISKHGRCNRYDINTRKNLRHALESHCSVGALLKALSHGRVRPRKPVGEQPQPEESVDRSVRAVEINPKPKAAAKAEPEPKAEPKAEAKPVAPENPVAAKKSAAGDAAKKPEKKVDTRQQGSLF